jgi:hypothetical protein
MKGFKVFTIFLTATSALAIVVMVTTKMYFPAVVGRRKN